MNWNAPSSSAAASSPAAGIEQHTLTRRHLPFSILLNPNDDDDSAIANVRDGEDAHEAHEESRFTVLSPSSATSSDSESAEKAMAALTTTISNSSITTTVSTADNVPPQPKRRGRKPHLPKMNNSERGKYYRNKRKRYGDTLTEEVELLREQIARLSVMRNICCDLSISTRMSLPGSLAKLVREYFVQFRYGVQLPPSRRNMALADVEICTTQQDLFMNAAMERDVGFGEYGGIATVMDQWRRYSQWHALLSFELVSVEISGPERAPIVATKGQLRTRYSRKTIENVFPHILGNEPLIQRLIGTEIVYPCQNLFYFSEEGRVQRYDVEASFAEAMVNALGNTEDAALLLGQALIQQQHMMGVLDDELVTANGCNWVEYVSTGGDRDTTNRGTAQ
ncbi:hypothetical protein Gpo141_00011925 [Globisporangium polare]